MTSFWFLLMVALSLVDGNTACPRMCVCMWKNGKETVDCGKRNLQSLPEGAREETQVLVLSDNSLDTLPAESFRSLKHINLQRLYLSKSRIKHISPNAYLGLTGLVELDLSLNMIEDVPTQALHKVFTKIVK